jgi:hypothetical protein
MTPLPEDETRRRLQRDRSRITALLLGAFVILMFAISMAKMMVNQ